MQLGEILNSKRCQVVSRVCELLLQFYFQICKGSSPFDVFDKKECGDDVGLSLLIGVLVVEGRLMWCANASIPRFVIAVHSGNRCFKDSSGGCTDVGPRWRSSPHWVYKSIFKAYRVVIFGLWERSQSHHILLHTVPTSSRGLPRRGYSDDKSPTIGPPHGAASFVPVAFTLPLAWIISIHLARNDIPTGQS